MTGGPAQSFNKGRLVLVFLGLSILIVGAWLILKSRPAPDLADQADAPPAADPQPIKRPDNPVVTPAKAPVKKPVTPAAVVKWFDANETVPLTVRNASVGVAAPACAATATECGAELRWVTATPRPATHVAAPTATTARPR